MDFVTQTLEQNELKHSTSVSYSDRFENDEFMLDREFDYDMIGFGRYEEEFVNDDDLYNEIEEIDF